EQRARANELLGTGRRETVLGNEVTDGPSFLDNFRRLDNWLAERFPGAHVNMPGQERILPHTAPVPTARPEPETGSMFRQFLDGMRKLPPERDPIPTLESIRSAIGQPTPTQDVREVNPAPRPNITVNVSVSATGMSP